MEEILENYQVDGIHFDDYFYPNLDIDNEVSNAIDRIISEYYEDYSGVITKSKKFLKEIK